MTLAGQVAVVTGASRGIGRAIALSLAKAGAYVVLNYRGNQTAADASLAAIVEQGGRGELSRFDVANESEIEQAVKKIVDGHNKIDILVNNAGVTADNLLMRISAVDWDQVIGTNLKGTILCTKVVSRHMIRQRFGRILNMSSVAGQTGNAGQSLYAASKAGIIGFTKTIARELASRNVTANVIAPGFIETDMTAKLSEQQREKSVQLIPLGRFGTCQEVADMVVFLAGEKAGYITGQVFGINGGLYM
ncbi:MAG TPA: 3-oxoacyl-[acyl-carrier-protein] reductase [Candidatus Binatia bacterium]|nr:3-oxoacyl-[acyl-carrier-protein] reductase [Candidatus Binatia bacterium]